MRLRLPRARLALLLAGGTFVAALAHAADKLTVQLDWLPGGATSFVYAGVGEGFFAAEGLELDIAPGRGSSDALTEVATGSADVGFAALSALMVAAAESPVPVKAVMSLYSKQPDALFTTRGSGIEGLRDVAGKTVATAPFTSSNALWPVVLDRNGIDAAKIRLLKVDASTLAPMLARGGADATINWVTVAPGFRAVLEQAGKELVVLPWSADGLDGYGWSVIAGDTIIKERPDVLRRYLRALARSVQFALDNPDKAAADLKAAVPEADAAVLAADFRASIPLLQNEISQRDGLGAYDPKLLGTTWGWVAKSMGLTATKVDPEKLVDRSFLPN